MEKLFTRAQVCDKVTADSPSDTENTLTEPYMAQELTMRTLMCMMAATLLGASTLEAQVSIRGDRFGTPEACKAAFANGAARYYVPSFLKPVPLQAGEEERPLEHDACVRMQIVGAIAWVPQAAGTCFVFKNGLPVRRCDCGNKVYGIVYPDIPVAQTPVVYAPELPRLTPDTMFHFVEHFGTVEDRSPVVIRDERSWLSRNKWPVGIGTAIAGGVLGYMCITDWCRSDEDIRIKINIDSTEEFLKQGLLILRGR